MWIKSKDESSYHSLSKEDLHGDRIKKYFSKVTIVFLYVWIGGIRWKEWNKVVFHCSDCKKHDRMEWNSMVSFPSFTLIFVCSSPIWEVWNNYSSLTYTYNITLLPFLIALKCF